MLVRRIRGANKVKNNDINVNVSENADSGKKMHEKGEWNVREIIDDIARKKIQSLNIFVNNMIKIIALIFMMIMIVSCINNDINLIVAIGFCCIVVIGVILLNKSLKKDNYSKKYRKDACKFLWIVHFILVFWSNIDYAYLFGFMFSIILVLYFDVIFVFKYNFIVSMINFIAMGLMLKTGKMLSGEDINMQIIKDQVTVTLLFGTVIIILSYKAGRYYTATMSTLLVNNNKMEGILNNLVGVAEFIKKDVDKGNQYMESLDISTDNTLQIFSEIDDGNKSTAQSAEKQVKMTKEITKLINRTEADTYSAMDRTYDSLLEMEKSRENLDELKKQSNAIMNYNNHVLDTITEFVESTGKVKEITEGIKDISAQTKLLSLNASIESARAGIAGRGFAVVSQEVRNLAYETVNLTGIIENIVATLEKNALATKEMVESVVQSINLENAKIADTVNSFDAMEKDMKGLEDDMKNVLSSTKEVVNYNSQMSDHLEQLVNYTEKLALSTGEAYAMNEKNKKMTSNTKELMKGLYKRTEKIIENETKW